jgi:hypothetical protein
VAACCSISRIEDGVGGHTYTLQMILLRTGSGELDSEHPVVQGKKRYAHGDVEVDVATAMTMTIV